MDWKIKILNFWMRQIYFDTAAPQHTYIYTHTHIYARAHQIDCGTGNNVQKNK